MLDYADFYLPIPVLLILKALHVLVGVVVDKFIIVDPISDVTRRVKVEAEKVGRALEGVDLGPCENRKSRLG